MRAAKGFLVVAIVTTVAASTALAIQVSMYLATPFPINSSTARFVFRGENDRLMSYEPFQAGPSVAVIGLGIVSLAAAVLVAAIVWRRPMAPA